MSNLSKGNSERNFFVWIDPKNFIIKHQIEKVGGFASTSPNENNETLMFIPNPDFKGWISYFQNNLLNFYITEYDLELSRRHTFKQYPSRLQAIFLIDTKKEALEYARTHPEHVGKRILKRVKTNGNYIYSKHDSSWVDFFRMGGMKDKDTIHNCTTCYWNGTLVKNCELQHFGEAWTQEPIVEILFLGRIEFYDRNLTV